ncbi:MAG TPA: response regulator transcription factor [Verrucomicrobiae bacterium]|nr:response regulator transcription factor [Verrucomicrobiae bacterium]
MQRPLRIVVADDHPVVREGIRMCLSDWADLEIVGEARDGQEAIECVRAEHPDVVLLDLTMPRMGGLEAVPRIRRLGGGTRVIILTVHNTQEYIRQAMAARVDGYLLKDTAPTEYVDAIHTVMAGKFFISPAVAEHARPEVPMRAALRFGLTPREYQYLLLAARGGRLADIAATMGCSPATVRTYRRKVYRKLNIQNPAMLTQFALKHGL